MFFADSMPVPLEFGASFWTLAFFVNLGLFLLFTSAIFSIADEFKAFSRPTKLAPYSLITVSLGLFIDRAFTWASNLMMQDLGYHRDFYLMLAKGGQQGMSLRFLVLPSLACFAMLMIVQFLLIRWFFGDRIGIGRILWMSGLIAFLTHPVWITVYMLLRMSPA